MSKPDLSDYNTVAERIAEFRAKYPEGRLRPLDPDKPYTIEKIGGDTFVVVIAAAYRDLNDSLPGVGMAWEPYPGRTPYTKWSELMVGQTSAWGRAIVAALAADTRKGIASREEIDNRSGSDMVMAAFPDSGLVTESADTPQARSGLRRAIASLLATHRNWTPDQIKQHFLEETKVLIDAAPVDVLQGYLDTMKEAVE